LFCWLQVPQLQKVNKTRREDSGSVAKTPANSCRCKNAISSTQKARRPEGTKRFFNVEVILFDQKKNSFVIGKCINLTKTCPAQVYTNNFDSGKYHSNLHHTSSHPVRVVKHVQTKLSRNPHVHALPSERFCWILFDYAIHITAVPS
jgi:hypothetical protein